MSSAITVAGQAANPAPGAEQGVQAYPTARAPTAATNGAGGAGGGPGQIPPAPRFPWIYKSPQEDLGRRRLATAAALACLVFLGCAVSGVATRTAFAPLPFGSTLWIELGMGLQGVFPGLWLLGPVHNLVLALVAGALWAGASVAHAEIPGNPNDPHTLVWRRQARFVLPQVLLAAALFCVSIALHQMSHPLLATLFQGPAWVATLAAIARLWLPIALRWLIVRYRPGFTEGMASSVTVGGGVGPGQETFTIFPGDFISAQHVTTPLEFMAGLAGIRFTQWGPHGEVREWTIRCL
jgi:hypothetical protein